jgi:hypothetical protein
MKNSPTPPESADLVLARRVPRHIPGSARVSRAGFGVAPERTFLSSRRAAKTALQEKFANARGLRQHARRLRYPENTCAHFSELISFNGSGPMDKIFIA